MHVCVYIFIFIVDVHVYLHICNQLYTRSRMYMNIAHTYSHLQTHMCMYLSVHHMIVMFNFATRAFDVQLPTGIDQFDAYMYE